MPIFDPILRNWIPGVELIIRRGVHYMSFKDGIFQRSIPSTEPYTPDITTAALNTLLGYDLMNGNEKRTLLCVRDLYVRLLRDHGKDYPWETIVAIHKMGEQVVKSMVLNDDEHQLMSHAIEHLEDMFEADRSQRGIRIPSRGYQFVNDEGWVQKTIFFDVDGHQLCVTGDYFKDITLVESRDYYEMPKQGPDGCALRSLTASFMVAQGCQTPEYNDLAFEEKQKEEVMMYIQAKGDNAFVAPDIPIAQDNGYSSNPPYEKHKLQQPCMFLERWNVAKTHPNIKTFQCMQALNFDIPEQIINLEEDDGDMMDAEEDKEETKKPMIKKLIATKKKPAVVKKAPVVDKEPSAPSAPSTLKYEFLPETGRPNKKLKVSACEKVKGMGAAVGSALSQVKAEGLEALRDFMI